MERCKKIKSQLIQANLTEPLEFLILVTHGFFVQKVPILFEGQGGYADYCSCSCVEVTQNTNENGLKSTLYFDTTILDSALNTTKQ